jgi:hypothetical protein
MCPDNKDYRFDKRTKEQFIEDIKNATKVEQALMKYYVGWLNRHNKRAKSYTYRDNGIDNSGKFLEKADSRADFCLDTPSGKSHLIEIKFSRKENKNFHIKVTHVNRCITDDVCVVVFMDVDGENKRFCILTPDMLRHMMTKEDRIVKFHPWGGKLCLKIANEEVDWHQ